MFKQIVVSRTDRIGDLLLSLPAIGHLKRHFKDSEIYLHHSPYTSAIAELALSAKIVDKLWPSNFEQAPSLNEAASNAFIALFHSSEAKQAIQKHKSFLSYGPRSKLSTLWTYTKTLSQKRSQVLRSEMEYNLDLISGFLKWLEIEEQDFQGLSPFMVPSEWQSPVQNIDTLIAVSNRGSAKNLSPTEYVEHAIRAQNSIGHIAFLATELSEQEELKKALVNAPTELRQAPIIGALPSLQNLIALISSVKRVWASSTGPLHLGHALGKEVLGFYPKVKVQSFKRWRPAGYWHSSPVRYEEI